MEKKEKQKIELFQSLKNKAYQIFKSIKDKKDIGLSEIESILEIYDIDPIINEFYLQKCLDYCLKKEIKNVNEISNKNNMEIEISNENKNEISIETFSEKYLQYINSLSLSQKINLNKRIKTETKIYIYMERYINGDSNIKKIYQIFQYIFDNKKKYDINKFKSLFYTDYFINIEQFHIPLVYGTLELRYSAIINDIKSFLFDNQIFADNSFQEDKYSKAENYSQNIIGKKINEELPHKNNQENNNNIKICEDSEIKSIRKKLAFLYGFVQIIFDSEDKKIFDYKCDFENDDLSAFGDNYILNDNIDFLYYNFLYLDVLMYCYLNFQEEITHNINQFLKIFETSKDKEIILSNHKNENNLNLEIINVNEAKNDFEIIKIRYYNENDTKEYFEFNPYEYNIKNIQFFLTYDDFKKQFENKKNFSLYKFYKENNVFTDDNLNYEYKKNINEMLISNISDKAFDKVTKYNKFKNPFKEDDNKEILEQINRVKYYIYFPLSKFRGLTFQRIGIIFINKAFKEMSRTDKKTKLIKSLINISDKKITEFHEIIAHYTLILCRVNSMDVELKTLNNTLIEETSDNVYYNKDYDDRDKLESFLFGDKITYLTIQAALFIISEKSWNLNNVEDFRNQFTIKNEIKQEEINLSQENNLVKAILNAINLKNEDLISVNLLNSFIDFETIDDNNIYDSDEEGEAFHKFSITSNAFLPRKISISKIIKQYGSNQ